MASNSETPRLNDVSNATGDETHGNSNQLSQNDAVGPNPQGRLTTDDTETGRNAIRVCKNTIKIGTWNVQSMKEGRTECVINEMERLSIDILGISEMRWKERGHTTTNDHVIYFSGHEEKKIHGVGIICTKKISKSILGYNPVNDRIMTLRLDGRPTKITIIAIYAPTASADEASQEKFYDDFQKVIDNTPKRDLTIVTGDFNAKVGDQRVSPCMGKFGLGNRNEAGDRLLDFCSGNDLAIMNTMFQQHPRRRYTWTSPDGVTKNQIDYIMTHQRWKTSVQSCKTYPGAYCGSDHQLVVARVKLKLKTPKKTKPILRFDVAAIPNQYKVEVKNRFEALRVINDEERSPEELWSQTRDNILAAAKDTVPRKKKKQRSEWISTETLDVIESRRKLKAQDSAHNRDQIRELSKEIRRRMRNDKDRYLNTKCKEIEENMKNCKTKDLFKTLRSITKKSSAQCPVIKDHDGKILTESQEIKDRWKTYCEELYKKDDKVNSHPFPIQKDEDEPPILLAEVMSAIHKLKNGKSPGCDDVPAELIKATGATGAKLMLKICNSIWKTRQWPTDWVKSIFIPLPKKGDTRQCQNNRTIALIPHASKIMLYIIAGRMEQYINRELPAEQAGFRKGRGTRDQIAILRRIVEKFIDARRPLYLAFIDYSKAFDCVDHNTLWKILKDMGFPNHVVALLQSLYSEQSAIIRTIVGDSETFKMGKGVRQGCILSPYLFNLYAENIMRNALTEDDQGISVGGLSINNLRYADDTTLLGSTLEELERLLSHVNEASKQDGLYLNVKKTNEMRINSEIQRPIIIDQQQVQQVTNFDFLGSLITTNGDSKSEIARRLAMARKSAVALDTIWRDHGITKTTKMRLMNSLVFSIATYACETWTLRKEERKRIEAFELWAWRRLLRISWNEHQTNVNVLNNIGNPRSLLNRVIAKQLTYFGHTNRRDGGNLEKQVMFGTIEGNRGRGRPRISWLDNLKKVTGMTLQELSRSAQNRVHWRTFVKRVTRDRVTA